MSAEYDDYDCYYSGDDDGDDDEYSNFDYYERFSGEWGKLHLFMMPKLGTLECPTAPWLAVLAVKCRDVPRLMREGFFWSAENVLPEQGYMSSETRPRWRALGCRHKRTWILADRADDDSAVRWVGQLDVVTPDLSLLANFQVKTLSRDNVYAADATNAHQRHIYYYDYRSPRYSYNCIYDNKPLKGWWPWPREEGTVTAFPDLDAGELFPLPLVAAPSQPSSCVIL
jgi:hypothetical protein